MLDYSVVDVFTDQAFAGNQLAVVWDADRLSDTEQRRIASEFGYSETAFVSRSNLPDCQWRVSIWTPLEEVEIAGHPLVGTTLLLKRKGEIASATVIETAAGPVELEIDDDEIAWMTQPKVEFGAVHSDPEGMAAALSLEPGDLRADLPTQVVAAGHEFLIVPVSSLAAMRRLRVRLDAWDATLDGFPQFAYCFSEEAEGQGVAAHCRLLAPHDIASGEDAASGSAAAPLACYLNEHGAGDRRDTFQFEQGLEIGRPSRLWVSGAGEDRPRVGGHAVLVAEGKLIGA